MRDHQGRPSGSLGARLLLWAERLLMIAGAATLIWCAVLVSDAVIAQRAARRSLAAASVVERPALPPPPEPAAAVPPPALAASRGSAIATLSIPRVHLSAVVLHGSDAQTLRRGPGHVEHTALPGEFGNVVIAGHRDSFFRPLRNIRHGDDIFVDTPQGRFQYQVTSLRVVAPHDVSVLAPTNEAILTLITCYPFWVLGSAPDRFVVRAAAVVDGAAAAPVARRPTPLHEAIGAPRVEDPPAAASVDFGIRGVVDDETLVQEAVERFRLIYNARLVSRHDTSPGGPIRSQACSVDVIDDLAIATCEAAPPLPDDPEPHARTFTLERADGRWAIKSLTLK